MVETHAKHTSIELGFWWGFSWKSRMFIFKKSPHLTAYVFCEYFLQRCIGYFLWKKYNAHFIILKKFLLEVVNSVKCASLPKKLSASLSWTYFRILLSSSSSSPEFSWSLMMKHAAEISLGDNSCEKVNHSTLFLRLLSVAMYTGIQ